MLALLFRSRTRRLKRALGEQPQSGLDPRVYTGVGDYRPGDIRPWQVDRDTFLAMRTLAHPEGTQVKRVKVKK